MTRFLVLMPTFNELESLPNTVATLLESNPSVHLLIIDDDSPDGTGQLADRMAAKDSRINVLHRLGKQGLGRAYLAGFEWGLGRDYTHLIEMDADGSHRAVDLPKLLAASVSADLVIGSRWVPGGRVENWPKLRQFISRSGNTYARLMLNSSLRDLTAGFRVYSRELLQRLPLSEVEAQGYGFQVEMTWRSLQLGAKIVEVPITFIERAEGNSKMSLKIVFEALLLTTVWGLTSRFRFWAKGTIGS